MYAYTAAILVVAILVTGIFSIALMTEDAYAGQGDKRINFTVKTTAGKGLPGVACEIQDAFSKTVLADGVTNNGGKLGLNFAPLTNTVDVVCTDGTTTQTIPNITLDRHTTKANFVF